MIKVRSFVFNCLLFGYSSAYIILLLWMFMPFDRKYMQAAVGWWSLSLIWLLRHVVHLDFQVRGRENLPDGPCILACKHQSAWETMIFYDLTPDPAYVIKKELMDSWFYGWYAVKAEMVRVDRDGGGAALKAMVRDVQRAVDKGRKVIIFPEGTRTAPGKAGTYFPGVAALYNRVDVPMVPVALNSGMFWARRGFVKLPGMITMEFLPAIPRGLKRAEFLEKLESGVEDATRRLEREAVERYPMAASALSGQ